MNPYVFVIASIMIVIIIILAYQETNDVQIKKPEHKYNDYLAKSVINKVRCPPKELLLYDDSMGYVKNKGFLNEIIYKPEFDYSQLQFASGITKNTMPLNDNSCAYSKDLPIGNIHVSYLINKKSTKLSL